MMKLVSHNHRNLKFENCDCTNPHKTKYNAKHPNSHLRTAPKTFLRSLNPFLLNFCIDKIYIISEKRKGEKFGHDFVSARWDKN